MSSKILKLENTVSQLVGVIKSNQLNQNNQNNLYNTNLSTNNTIPYESNKINNTSETLGNVNKKVVQNNPWGEILVELKVFIINISIF
jgi:hypothetical protein